MLIGVGLAVARLPVPDWVMAALGAYVFVVVTPALLGPMVVGRAAIGLWVLGFAGLARRLVREPDNVPA